MAEQQASQNSQTGENNSQDGNGKLLNGENKQNSNGKEEIGKIHCCHKVLSVLTDLLSIFKIHTIKYIFNMAFNGMLNLSIILQTSSAAESMSLFHSLSYLGIELDFCVTEYLVAVLTFVNQLWTNLTQIIYSSTRPLLFRVYFCQGS